MKIVFILMLFFNLSFSNDRFKKIRHIVIDNEVGVIWQSFPSPKRYTWSEAKSYCDTLDYDGYTGWRVPHIDELMSLIDKSKYNLAIITNLIDITEQKNNFYWSDTEYADDTYNAWNVEFNYGFSLCFDYKGDKYYVLCVKDYN